MTVVNLHPVCAPRWATPRNLKRKTRGAEAAAIADLLGLPLLPWQRRLFDVAMEVDEDSVYIYRDGQRYT